MVDLQMSFTKNLSNGQLAYIKMINFISDKETASLIHSVFFKKDRNEQILTQIWYVTLMTGERDRVNYYNLFGKIY